MSLLQLQSVSRRFGALQALSDISINVDHGELRAIIGPNGAGKTTLFNLISGFFPPSGGEILFDGQPIGQVNPASLVRQGIIRTFQITEIFLSLSVYENLRIAAEVAMGVSHKPWMSRALRARIDARVDELMQIVGIAGKADRITVLDNGSMLAEGTAHEIANNPAVQAAYLGQAA